MEKYLYIGDFSQISGRELNSFTGIYYGIEFCDRYLSLIDRQIKEVLIYCNQNNKKFVLVTPFCTNSGLNIIKNIIAKIVEPIEIVINDWGVYNILKNTQHKLILGRLLVRIPRDPRLSNNKEEDFRWQKEPNVATLGFQKYLIEKEIYRIELDNVKQGYDFVLNKKIHSSLYIPYVYVTTSRKCFYLKQSANCHYECRENTIKFNVSEYSGDIILKGGTQFYYNEFDTGTNYERLNMDRVIEMAVNPSCK